MKWENSSIDGFSNNCRDSEGKLFDVIKKITKMKLKQFLLPCNKVLFVLALGISLTALKAESKVSDLEELKNDSPADRLVSINEFMRVFLEDQYTGRTIGEDIIIEISDPVEIDSIQAPRFKNWNFYSISWTVYNPHEELNAYPVFRLKLAVNPENKYYPILSSGTKNEQFVKLWNENFERIENEDGAQDFYQAYCEILGRDKSVEKLSLIHI